MTRGYWVRFDRMRGTQACGLRAQRGFSPLFFRLHGSGVKLRWAHTLGSLCSFITPASQSVALPTKDYCEPLSVVF